MERQLLSAIVSVLLSFGNARCPARFDFSDFDIVRVYFWSVINDRPIRWACVKDNWPIHLWKKPLPSQSTMSRRLRSASVIALLDAVEERVVAPKEPGLFWMVDGKPLPIGGCSKDRQAGYGKAAGCMAKGYKIHALVGSDGSVARWRVAPMNKDERVMAERLVKTAPAQVVGYLIADANFDSNPLHEACQKRGELQLLTPRRYGAGKSLGHRKQSAGRLRSIALTESPFPAFAKDLLNDRVAIERNFGNLTNWGGGLTCLPAWVRTHRRVRRWVQAKIVLAAIKRNSLSRSCAA